MSKKNGLVEWRSSKSPKVPGAKEWKYEIDTVRIFKLLQISYLASSAHVDGDTSLLLCKCCESCVDCLLTAAVPLARVFHSDAWSESDHAQTMHGHASLSQVADIGT